MARRPDTEGGSSGATPGTAIAARRLLAVVVLASIAASPACVRKPRWRATDVPDAADAELALNAANVSELYRDPAPSEIPAVPIRQRLRPCCAFGVDLAASVGKVPVPAFRIGNICGPEEVGPHTYDSGVVHIRQSEQQKPLLNNENDGLVYTCRGGFIDTAHARDYADWAMFIGSRFARDLETGTTIRLPDEGGARTIVLKPLEPELLERYDRVLAAANLAQWITLRLSIWHEIATWFWWSSVRGFPEKSSAFSPEDVYSNLVGIKIAMALGYRRSARTENQYNQAVTRWLDEVLAVLGAVPKDAGRAAMRAVDGVWWDSNKRLPDPTLVIRRSFDIDSPITPWVVREALASPDPRAALREHCGEKSAPWPLYFREAGGGIRFSDYVTLHIEVDDNLAAQSPFTELGRNVTEADFPAIVAGIREQNREEFGPGSDRPD